MSAASSNRSRSARRWRWSAALGALVVVGGYVGCGFPSYTYDDNAFYDASAGASAGAGGSSANGGTSGTGASSGSGGATGGSGGVGGSTGGSGGTAGNAAAGGTSGAGGSTGGAGGFAGTENCTNGKDDDGNGKIDCQDPACQTAGYSCAPTVTGWNGPVAMWSGTTGSEPSCTGAYISPATSGNSGLQPGTATCQTCSCGSPTGGSCSTVDIKYYDSTACDQGCWGCSGTPFTLTDGASCKVFGEIHGPNGESPKAAEFTPPTASGSTCAPGSTGTQNIPTPTWSTAMVACGGEPGGGRGCGDVTTECVPKPTNPFSSICIYKTGDVSCPSGLAYTKKHVYYADFNDTRACDACTCGTPTGQSCTGTVKTYTDSCVSNVTTMTTPNQCTQIPADTSTATYDGGLEDTRGATYTGGTPSGGSCTPSGGGQPTGSVTESSPVTFCCI